MWEIDLRFAPGLPPGWGEDVERGTVGGDLGHSLEVRQHMQPHQQHRPACQPGRQYLSSNPTCADLIEKGYQFKTFLAMKFTTQHDLY